MRAIRQQESFEEREHRLNVLSTRKPTASRVLVISKQSNYHRHQDKVLNSNCEAWRLVVKVTNYQDKDEVLSKSLYKQERFTADLKTMSLFNITEHSVF